MPNTNRTPISYVIVENKYSFNIISISDVCKADPAITYPTDYYERGYLVDTKNGHLYVCSIPAPV
jgi:hypothetical protein